ncbi:MAG: CCA tRNA nucleotidyltransferase, partial [Phycisphaerales bacterium]|nr:CCA tRNA nucleotidyltransferase [Phycisphaerales bacterium]
LLGLTPTDYDVATDATPDRVRALFRRSCEVGAHFGVVLVRVLPAEIDPNDLPAGAGEPDADARAGIVVEVATFRSDGPYSDRRRPDAVTFSTPEDDAHRRDFTINALFLDPLAPPEAPGVRGRVIDYVGGRADLAKKIVRAVGDPEARLAEDHLRALRAVRFAARLGFDIEPATGEAIRRHARDLVGVSRERIGDEVRRMLSHPARARAAALLASLDLDAPTLGITLSDAGLRTLMELGAAPALPNELAAIWRAGFGSEGAPIERPPFPAALAAMLSHELAGGASRGGSSGTLRASLVLSNDEHAALRDTLDALARLRTDWPALEVAARKRLAARPAFVEALRILRADDPDRARAIAEEVETLAADGVGLAPPPLVTGDHLVDRGHRPGPAFKGVLDATYDAQLEGAIKSPKEGILFAGRLLGGASGA